MKPLVHLIYVFFLLSALVPAQEISQLVKTLGAESFEAREEAQRALLLRIPAEAKTIQAEALRLYPDPEADPETRIRLLQILEQLAKETSFEEKNGFIGLTIGQGNAFIQDGERREVVPAVLVMTVMAGMEGEKAGIKQNDQIFAIDGKPFDRASGSTTQFMKRIGFSAPGKQVELSLMRAGKRKDVQVELMKRPGDLPPGYYDAGKDFEQFFNQWLDDKTAGR